MSVDVKKQSPIREAAILPLSQTSRLPACRLRIVMQSKWAARIPPYPGMMLRGAMGHALKRVFCTVAHRDCERCHVQEGCGYFQIFHTENQARKSQGYFFSPHPYIIRVGSVQRQGEETLIEWHLTVLGDAIREAPYLILAFEAMGKSGFGKGHTPFELLSVYDEFGDRELWNMKEKSIRLPQATNLYDIARNRTQALTHSAVNTAQALLRLQSPLRIEIKKKRIRQLKPKQFFDALFRRIRLIHACHGTSHLELAQEEALPKRIEKNHENDTSPYPKNRTNINHQRGAYNLIVSKLLKEIAWKKVEEKEVAIPRYSNRQGRRLEMRGLIGSYQITGLATDLHYWLALGEMLHIGKSTAFGFGHYTLELQGRP